MPSTRYSTGAIVLHWLLALLIALNFAAAWISEGMSRDAHRQIMANHMAIGLTILVLTLVRIGWRLAYKAPAFEASLKPWEAGLARVTHILFYVLMLAIPLTGWAMASVGGKPISWFGLFGFPALPMGADRSVGRTFHSIHANLAWAMIALFVLHVVGALKHQLLDHDGTMHKMVPFVKRRA